MKPLTRATSILIAAAAIVIAGGITAYSLVGEEGVPRAPQYVTAEVTRGRVVQAIVVSGVLSPLTSVEVSSQISGLVTEVKVDFNSVVKKGDVLARIDSSTYEQRLRQATADLAAAKATHALATLNAARLRELRNDDLVPQQDYDQIEALLQQSNAALLTQRAVVANARVDLERCTLTSPIDGVVIYRQIEVGKTVVSSFSAPTLFAIANDLSRMRILASISEVDVARVRPGQRAEFTVDAFPNRVFEGRLTQVRNPYTPSDKVSQQQSGSEPIAKFDAVIEVRNAELLLKPSQTVNVSIVVSERDDVLRVPNNALRVGAAEAGASVTERDREFTTSPSSRILRLADASSGAVERIAVRTGLRDDLHTEVLEGLREGDRVATGWMTTSAQNSDESSPLNRHL